MKKFIIVIITLFYSFLGINIVLAADTTPDPFTFIDRTEVALNVGVANDYHITISGIDAPTPISVVGGKYSINTDSGPYTSANGTVSNGDAVKVWVMSSGSYSTTTSATLTIGGVSATFNATTHARVVDIAGTVRYGATGFSIGNKGYIGTGFMYLPDGRSISTEDFWEYKPETDTWTQIADFKGPARLGAFGFSIGNKGYIGTGQADSYDGIQNAFNDFWEYDPATNTWTQKADMGVAPRSGAVAFTIDNKGYVGTGSVYDDTFGTWGWSCTNAFFEYNPETDTWTQMTGIPLGRPCSCAAFSIGSKGYIGTGYYTGLGHSGTAEKYFWEYDPLVGVGGTWTQKTDFGGEGRYNAIGLAIGNNGYIGMGMTKSGVETNDFWKYNPETDTWTQIADCEGVGRINAAGFSVASKIYVGTGKVTDASSSSIISAFFRAVSVAVAVASSPTGTKDFWEYDSLTNNWTRKADLGGTDPTPTPTGGGGGGGGGGSGCFIATAAFGTPLAGQVEILRQFRDRYLLTNALGQKFVSWYYRNSPVAAKYIQDKPLAKAAMRLALYPLIGFSLLLISGYLPFVMIGLLLSTLLFLRFRQKKLSVA